MLLCTVIVRMMKRRKIKTIFFLLRDSKKVVGECVHCDIRSTIRKTKTSMYNSKSRYIHQRYSTIKHLLSNEIIIDYVKLKKNIMDLLTKGFKRGHVYNSSRGMSLNPLKDERL